MTAPLRTAVVGFGAAADLLGADRRMAQWFGPACHAQVLADHPAFDWRVVVDPRAEARDRASGMWGIADVCAAVDEIGDREALDCAVLAMPPGAREAAVRALPNLRAVMVEKPLGRTLGESERFLELCDSRGILVQVAFWRRAVAAYRRLAAGELEQLVGKPQAVFGLYGNGLLNNGSHLIDFMRLLFGEVGASEALGPARRPAGGPIREDVDVPFALSFASGLTATVQPLDFGRYREVGVDIWGERGRLSILQEGLGLYRYPVNDNRGLEGEREVDSGNPEILEAQVRDCFRSLYDNLADALAGRGTLVSSGQSALGTEKIVHAVATAAAARKAA
jgi:predicted dehydrogenase